jgi:hypothetical protein
MPGAPARPFQSWSTTAEGIPHVIRYDEAALAGPKLEKLGTALRIRFRNLGGHHHSMFNALRLKEINGLRSKQPRPVL